jgi:hypothetical protein
MKGGGAHTCCAQAGISVCPPRLVLPGEEFPPEILPPVHLLVLHRRWEALDPAPHLLAQLADPPKVEEHGPSHCSDATRAGGRCRGGGRGRPAPPAGTQRLLRHVGAEEEAAPPPTPAAAEGPHGAMQGSAEAENPGTTAGRKRSQPRGHWRTSSATSTSSSRMRVRISRNGGGGWSGEKCRRNRGYIPLAINAERACVASIAISFNADGGGTHALSTQYLARRIRFPKLGRGWLAADRSVRLRHPAGSCAGYPFVRANRN